MTHRLRWLFTMALVFSCASAWGSPLPAISSSMLDQNRRGIVQSDLGFVIHAGDTDWEKVRVKSKNPFVVAVYRAPERSESGIQASLTVRVDPLEKQTSLKQYVKQWNKDYARFGFDVLESRPVKVNGSNGFMLDLATKESDKRLRQVVFIKNRSAVILTCRDHEASFAKTLKSCNQIIRNFAWVQATR